MELPDSRHAPRHFIPSVGSSGGEQTFDCRAGFYWILVEAVRGRPITKACSVDEWRASPYSFWGEKTRLRIADQVDRINHWTCSNVPYDWVSKTPATWFIDPPYQQQGRRYAHGSERLDFSALGEWAQSLPGQIIVCEASGADWLPFRPLYENRTVKYKKAHRTIQEMVYP